MKNREDANKITIKQFQWYQVQTKVRQIMSQLLQPFNKKQNQQCVKINDIKRNFALLSKRLDDHDFLLQRENAQKPTYIGVQDQKLSAMQSQILCLQSDCNTRLKEMQVTIKVYEQKIQQLNSLEKRLDSQISARLQGFNLYKDNIDTSMQLMMKRIQSQQDENNLLKNQTRNNLNKIQTKMIVFQNRVKDLEDQLKRKSNDIRRVVDDSVTNNQKLIKCQYKIVQILSRIDQKQKDGKMSEKFFAKVKEVENDLMFLHKYLQAYQPLYIQIQISDTLNSFLKGKPRRQVCLYEQKKFAKLHNHILMNDSSNLQDLMSAYSTNIRKIINRNRKYVVSLKVQESIKYGANLYEIRMEEDMHDDDEDSKKTVNMIVPEEEIQRALNDRWQQMQPEITKNIKQTLKPTNQWMKQLQQQSFLRFSKLEQSIQTCQKKNSQVKSSFQLQQSLYDKQMTVLKSLIEQSSGQSQTLRSYIKDILNFNSVLNHIVIQDEIDRQGTALYALKGKEGSTDKVNPTIQLDPNCVNCNQDNKNSQYIQQAFKMACLTYNPSQIKIDDQSFSREQILQISTNILERLKKKMDNSQSVIQKKTITKATKTIQIEQVQNNTKRTTSNRKSFTSIKDQIPSSARSKLKSSRGNCNDLSQEKDKNYQTLLPILGSSKKNIGTTNGYNSAQRNTHFSVFY